MTINPYYMDATTGKKDQRGAVLSRQYVGVLRGDGRVIELRKKFDRKSEAEKWAIRFRAKLMARYDAMVERGEAEPTA